MNAWAAMLALVTRTPSRGIRWTPGRRTGGLLAEGFDAVRGQVPGVIIERLTVTHLGDADNVYFIGDAGGLDRVQLDCAAG